MKSDQNKTLCISIEGNIGAGKTSLIEGIVKVHKGYRLIQEEVNSLLPLFYDDLEKYAFALQWGMLKSRIYQSNLSWIEKNLYNYLAYIHDRSVFGDYAFAIYNYILGNLSDTEMNVYEETLGGTIHDLSTIPYLKRIDFFVFINTNPTTCKRRVDTLRKRECELSIPLEYYIGIDDINFHIMTQLLLCNQKVFVLNNHVDNVDSIDNINIFHENVKKYNSDEKPNHYISLINGVLNIDIKNNSFIFESSKDILNTHNQIMNGYKCDAIEKFNSVVLPRNIMRRSSESIKTRYYIPLYEQEYKTLFMWLVSKHIHIYWYEC